MASAYSRLLERSPSRTFGVVATFLSSTSHGFIRSASGGAWTVPVGTGCTLSRAVPIFCAILALLANSNASYSGPNDGGVLLVHADPLTVFSADQAPYSGDSQVRPCSPRTNLPTYGTESSDYVWWVTAVFPQGSNPSLREVRFGINYVEPGVGLLSFGSSGDGESSSQNWPNPGSGTSVFWDEAQVSNTTEVYWFAGYGYYSSSTFSLQAHPTKGGLFRDGASPPNEDPIADYGVLGFGEEPGYSPVVDPLCTIQELVDAAASGDTIRVSNGVYSGPGNRDIDFGGKNLVLIGNPTSPDSCIINCEGSVGNQHRAFVIDNNAVVAVEGFTMVNGYVDTGVSGVAHGGALVVDDGDATFRNCVFRNSEDGDSNGQGGAVAMGVRTRRGNLTVEDCAFENNVARGSGGGLGGAICMTTSEGTGQTLIARRCSFASNSVQTLPGVNLGLGGGVHVGIRGIAEFDSCQFVGNVAEGDGGGISAWPEAVLDVRSTSFASNSAGRQGAAIHADGADRLSVDGAVFSGQTNGDWAVIASQVGDMSLSQSLGVWLGVFLEQCTVVIDGLRMVDCSPASIVLDGCVGELNDCELGLTFSPTGSGGQDRLVVDGQSSITLRRTLVTGCGSDPGVQIRDGSSVTMVNSTVIGGIEISESQLVQDLSLVRSIVCGGIDVVNSPTDISADCCALVGVGNNYGDQSPIDTDPLLCVPPEYCENWGPFDLHLQAESPCLPANSPCGELVGAVGAGCQVPVGACCVGSLCELRPEQACGPDDYLGDGTDCEPENPCNHSSSVSDYSMSEGLAVTVRPNPSTGSCSLEWNAPAGGMAQLAIFDSSGRLVRRLVETLPVGGRKQAHWDGRDDGGARLPSGIYHYRLAMEPTGENAVGRILLTR